MRASRLVSVLLLLQARGRLTAAELAAELEVSVRTVYRDVESLSAAGVPVYADRGPAGGYRLVDGYRTRLTGMTASEAESLFLAGVPGPAAELGLGAMLAAAELKLLAALPPELRSRAAGVREWFHLDAPGWFREAEHVPWLGPVADAVWNCRAVRVRYERWGPREVTRSLEPLGLVLKAGSWYLIASADGRGIRSYRVARIRALEMLTDTFTRPGDFDLASWWEAHSRELPERLYPGEAVVRVSPRGRQKLPLLGQYPVRAAEASASPPDADGWTHVVVPIESIDHAVADLLRFGPDAEVLAPDELRHRMAGAAHALAAMYPPP